MANAARMGGKLGPRLARLVSRAHHDHLQRSQGTRAKILAQGANHFWRGVGGEYRLVLSPIFRLLEERLADDNPAKPLISFLVRQPGEGAALVAGHAVTSSVGSSIGRLISNLLSPEVNAILADTGAEIADVNTYATAWAAGQIDEGEAERRVRMAGFSPEVWPLLRHAAVTRPDISTLHQLVNRHVVGEGLALEQLRAQGMPEEWAQWAMGLRRVPLAPADLADMVVRSILTEEEGAAYAAESGISAQDFKAMVLDTGNSLGNQELLFAYRRGIIDKATLEKGIRQGRTRDEWIPTLEALRYAPMTTADAVRAVVQNQLASDDGKTVAEQNGLDPKWWETLVHAYGRPIATMQSMELLNRGLMTQAEVEQAIRESNVKDKYIPLLLHLRRKLPALTAIKEIMGEGNLSPKDAVRLLEEQGYDNEVAVAYVAAASKVKLHGEHQLAKADILALYREKQIDNDQAREYLEALGYSHSEADALTGLTDAKRAEADLQNLLTHLRTLYVQHRIELSALSGQLDALGLSSERRDRLLGQWTLERDLAAPRLTAPTIERAFRQKVIDEADALGRLAALGYDETDARLLLALKAR